MINFIQSFETVTPKINVCTSKNKKTQTFNNVMVKLILKKMYQSLIFNCTKLTNCREQIKEI